MKKITYVIIATLIISLCLGVTSFATATTNPNVNETEVPIVTFSEDFRTMYFNDYVYYQRDVSGFVSQVEIDFEGYSEEVYEYDEELGEDVLVSVGNHYYDKGSPVYAEYKLSKSQEKIVKSIDIYGDDIIANITVYYKDSTSFSVDLLREDYIDDYEALKSGKFDNYEIEFAWPEDNIVKVNKATLLENEAEELTIQNYYYDYQSIYLHSDDGNLTYVPGVMLTLEDRYYYIDFNENNIESEDEFYNTYWEETGIKAHEITDETVVTAIKEAEEVYYADDYGYLYDDDLANNVSYVFLIIIFGVIPGIIFVISLVFAIIKKKTYRKLLFAVCGFTLAEIIIFIIFMVIANYK